jgi:hypothetical protein
MYKIFHDIYSVMFFEFWDTDNVELNALFQTVNKVDLSHVPAIIDQLLVMGTGTLGSSHVDLQYTLTRRKPVPASRLPNSFPKPINKFP